ncbi:hypothetical protein GGR55DRAFT_684799 [Xylaria sp. FL0064]|nr:hypothetical protein GGR55DRAFT_684799 [Xylaria sp. FL0064]
MRERAPHDPSPDPRTLEEEVHPPTYSLRVVTQGDKLTCREIDFQKADIYPPVSEEEPRKIVLGPNTPIYHTAKVILIRRIQRLLWEVEADGEMIICKVSMQPPFRSLAKELGAEQINNSVAQLHELETLWCNVKTGTVLIDNEGDATVQDFGGGNTVGWVDEDKYGAPKGDLQGLEEIMAALEE